MRGLPFTATEQDIRLFFYGLEIVEIVLATNCGKQNGEGIVIFRNKDDLTAAYVELFRSDSQEYESMKVDDNNVEKGMMKRRHRDADPYYPNKKTQRDSNVQDYANMAPTYQENGYFFNSDAVNYRKHINLPTNNYGSFYNTSSFKSNEYSAKMPQYSSSSIAFGGQELHETKPHHAFNKGIDMNAGSEDSYYSKQEEQALSLNQIQMRGIPFKITFPDIEQFFSPLSLSNVKLGYLEGSTRLSGDAIVSFHTVNDAIKALDKDKQTISSRYIELFNSKNAKLGKRTIYKYIHGQDSSESTANLPDIDDNHRQQNASTHPVPSRFGDNEGNAKPMRDNEPYLPQSVSYGNSYHQHGDHDSRTRSSGFFTNTTYKQMHIKQEGPSEYFRSQSKFF
uniref:RRM domain-containing protein n=1 Tax=Rhabditophanes sp. KR3021 TaxID=114890 RepID=A0AC35UGS4_9BILA